MSPRSTRARSQPASFARSVRWSISSSAPGKGRCSATSRQKGNTLRNFLCRRKDTLLDALEAMNRNRERIVFVVDAHKRLCGVLTYGDISVLLLKGVELSQEISGVLKKQYCFARQGDDRA